MSKSLTEYMHTLDKRIMKARTHILGLKAEPDFGIEKVYLPATFQKAEDFLVALDKKLDHKIDIPFILPGPNGSIDIHWKTAEYSLLVNVPEEGNGSITVSGESKGTSCNMKIDNIDYIIDQIQFLFEKLK